MDATHWYSKAIDLIKIHFLQGRIDEAFYVKEKSKSADSEQAQKHAESMVHTAIELDRFVANLIKGAKKFGGDAILQTRVTTLLHRIKYSLREAYPLKSMIDEEAWDVVSEWEIKAGAFEQFKEMFEDEISDVVPLLAAYETVHQVGESAEATDKTTDKMSDPALIEEIRDLITPLASGGVTTAVKKSASIYLSYVWERLSPLRVTLDRSKSSGKTWVKRRDDLSKKEQRQEVVWAALEVVLGDIDKANRGDGQAMARRLELACDAAAKTLGAHASAPANPKQQQQNKNRRRGGRTTKDETDARRAAFHAMLSKHPRMIDDIPALARECMASESTVRRWIEKLRKADLDRR